MVDRRATVLLSVLCLGLTACTGGAGRPVDPSQSSSQQEESAHPGSPTPPSGGTLAILDKTTASIRLPLDSYGMSQKQQNVALAAQKIIFARCFTGEDRVPDSTMRIVKDLLAHKDESNWEFGYWSTDYIRANGFLSLVEAGQFTDELEWADQERTQKCQASDEYLALEPIAVSYGPTKGVLKELPEVSRRAMAKALVDPRFKALIRQRVQCLARAGIGIDGASDVGSASLPDDLRSKEALDIVLADAKCGDELNIVQQEADLVAFYQDRYIKEQQDRFIEIKQIADQRFRRAEGVLKETGVI